MSRCSLDESGVGSAVALALLIPAGKWCVGMWPIAFRCSRRNTEGTFFIHPDWWVGRQGRRIRFLAVRKAIASGIAPSDIKRMERIDAARLEALAENCRCRAEQCLEIADRLEGALRLE